MRRKRRSTARAWLLCTASALLVGCGDGETDSAAPDDASVDVDGAAPRPDAGMDGTTYEVAFADDALTYTTAYPVGEQVGRELAVRIWYPRGLAAKAPVVLVSHGGSGTTTGHRQFEHVGRELASHGYVAVHINHRPSTDVLHHRWDRPSDVSAVLTALEGGDLSPPSAFEGTLDLERVGHLGHSWGAYTAHAVAGAEFENPDPAASRRWNFRDERVDAIVALSPQGWGQFGAFDVAHEIDAPSDDNSWQGVPTPVFSLVGELEKDGVAGVETGNPRAFRTEDWRLFPFVRSPADGRRYLSVLPGQTHADLGGGASPDVNAHVAVNARLFFDVYLRDRSDREPEIGRAALLGGVDHRRR